MARYRWRLGKWERMALAEAPAYTTNRPTEGYVYRDERGIRVGWHRAGGAAPGPPSYLRWTAPTRPPFRGTHAQEQAYRRAVRTLADKGLIERHEFNGYGGWGSWDQRMYRTEKGERLAQTLQSLNSEPCNVSAETRAPGAPDDVLQEPCAAPRGRITSTDMARPAINPKDRRSQLIAFRVKASERALLDRAARRKGTPLTAFVREAALREAARATKGGK